MVIDDTIEYISRTNLKISFKVLELIYFTIFTSSYKTKFAILQAIGIIQIKSKETRVVAYTCRYSSGPLIPNSAKITNFVLYFFLKA